MAPTQGLGTFGIVVALVVTTAGCAARGAAPWAVPEPLPDDLLCRQPCLRLLDEGAAQTFETTAAANPRDRHHLVVGASETGTDPSGFLHRWNKAYVSHDGGTTWKETRLPGGPSAGPNHPLYTATDMDDPVVAFLPDGSALYAGMAYHLVQNARAPGGAVTGYSLFVARSYDGGATYPVVSVVAQGRGVSTASPNEVPILWIGHDKEWLSVGADGTVLLTWTEIQAPRLDASAAPVNQHDILFSFSSDQGATWSAPRRVAADGTLSGSHPLVRSDGTWLVAYLSDAPRELRLATSRDRGATWTSRMLVDKIEYSLPDLVAHNASGTTRLWLSYAAPGPNGGEIPTLIHSDDGGRAWSQPLLLDRGGRRGWTQPSLTIDAAGDAYVSFYRLDGATGRTDLRVVRVTDGSVVGPILLDSDLGGAASQRTHYTGAAALDHGAFISWVTGPPNGFNLAGSVLMPS